MHDGSMAKKTVKKGAAKRGARSLRKSRSSTRPAARKAKRRAAAPRKRTAGSETRMPVPAAASAPERQAALEGMESEAVPTERDAQEWDGLEIP